MGLPYYWAKLSKRLQGKAIRGSRLDETSVVYPGSNIVNSKLGRYTYCGYDCWIIEADVGCFCSISNNVRIGGPSHPLNLISTSPVFHKGRNVFHKNISDYDFNPFMRTTIENDVWIGEYAILKAGIKVENGSVIGAGAVITKDIGPYEIWAGNPGRLIGKRFDENTAEELTKSEWWLKSDNDLEKIADNFARHRKLER